MDIESNYGNLVEIESGKEVFEGRLVKSPESGVVLLKLSNGYNIGFNKKEIVRFRVIKKIKKKNSDFVPTISVDKKNVALVLLGGTILSKLNPGKGGVDFVETPEDLFLYYSKFLEKVNVKKIAMPFSKGSENMDFKDWQKIAKVVCDLLNEKGISGVLVLQGTDTLHYTSSALSFFLKDVGKPVVITYSQRSIDRGSSDAQMNLLCSAEVLMSNLAGVVVVGHSSTNDDFCDVILGTKARKFHTSSRDAFKSVNREVLARAYEDKVEIVKTLFFRNEKKKTKIDSKFEEKVGIVKFYPGQDPDILNYYLKKKYRGLVIEFLGIGNIAVSGARLPWTKKIKELISKGVTVCATAQTIYGRLNPLVYVTGRELANSGVIFLEDMLTETAFVKLGWVLGHKAWSTSREKIREKMLENVAGEFNDRLLE